MRCEITCEQNMAEFSKGVRLLSQVINMFTSTQLWVRVLSVELSKVWGFRTVRCQHILYKYDWKQGQFTFDLQLLPCSHLSVIYLVTMEVQALFCTGLTEHHLQGQQRQISCEDLQRYGSRWIHSERYAFCNIVEIMLSILLRRLTPVQLNRHWNLMAV